MEQGFERHALQIGLLAALWVLRATALASGPNSTIVHLPNVQINAAKVDASGKIYLAGHTTTTAGSVAAYISKLSPDGATTYYTVALGGSGASISSATAVDIDSAGAVYVAGTTTASDFPVSAGAAQSTGATGFAAKLDPQGNTVYAALIGGNAKALPNSVVVNSKGELAVSGQATTGAPPAAVVGPFLLKLSADGATVVTGPQGIGGRLAADSQNNIYVAGDAISGSGAPAPTPGAFQGVPSISFCGCPFLSFPCGGNQFVASLTADLSQTRFLTYVTAKYGAAPAYIALDAQGDVLVAGTTSSPGYPTTPDSYLPIYTAASGTIETCGPPIPLEFTSPSGYVTLVKSDGAGLIFSTFFSGTKSDTIGFAALTSAGIYIAGQAGSVDLPGFDGAVPLPCAPVGFVTRLTLDGSGISSTRTPPGTPLAYDSTTETLLLVSGNDLIRFDPSAATPIACVLDAADLRPVTAVAPGELLSMFGRFLYLETNPFAVTIRPVNGSFPVTSQGLGIMANHTPAPLLYVSEQQVNLQAPYEIAGSPQTDLTLTYSDVNGKNVSDSRTLRVAASSPVAFVSQPSSFNQIFPLALNADGTVNSETNPAAAGSVVTIFLDGLGVTSPQPISGLVNQSPAALLNVPIVVTPYCNGAYCYPAPAFLSAGSLPGSISGVTQVQLRAPANPNPGSGFQAIFSLSAGPTPVRDMNLSFWVE
jgi:uncharacterized protein (TIGR03437 family)